MAVADGAQRLQQEVQNAKREIKVHTKSFVYFIFYDVPPSLVTLNQYLAVGTNLTAYLCLPAEVTSFASWAALLFLLLPCTVVTVFVKYMCGKLKRWLMVNYKLCN